MGISKIPSGHKCPLCDRSEGQHKMSCNYYGINYDVIDEIVNLNKHIDNYVPFVSQVEEFNHTMGKPEANQKFPTVSDKKTQNFISSFLKEEILEYEESCKENDIINIADALGDIMYVLCNGILAHGLKDKFLEIYEEIQNSNMSKVCKTEEEAQQTVEIRSKEQGEDCHYEKINNHWVIFRTRDKKVLKSINYFKPDLKKII